MNQITSGNFTFTKTSIDGVVIVDVKSYGDERGYFMETYKQPDFVAGGIDVEFVQDNQSSSTKGVLRGTSRSTTRSPSSFVWCRARSLTWLSTFVHAAPRTERGRAWSSRPRTAASSLFRVALPMAFWCCQTSPSSATSATTSTIPTTRVA